METLTCGCCGNHFEGIQDVAHDFGFGDCARCESENEDRANSILDQIIEKIEKGFKPENAESFKRKTIEQKRMFAMKMVEKGFISWSI